MSALLAAVLQGLDARLASEGIERAWLFPPRRLGERESGLAVLALYPDAEEQDAQRRRLLTVRYQATHDRRGTRREEELIEEGSAPAERIERVIAGVLRRLGDGAEAPRSLWIGGDSRRWTQLLEELSTVTVDPTSGE